MQTRSLDRPCPDHRRARAPGQGRTGPGSGSGAWYVLGSDGATLAAFERVGRGYGDRSVRQGQVPILAIGGMKSCGDSDDDAELVVDEAENLTSR